MSDVFSVKRIEEKYNITLNTSYVLWSEMSRYIPKDVHALGEGYLVRSLYFDSIYNNDYLDKIEGLEYRKKIRIRIYDTKQNTAKLEWKQKIGKYQEKKSMMITKEEAQELILGNYQVLLRYDHPLAFLFYEVMAKKNYVPKCVISYKRKAFEVVENDIRVTFDYELEGSEIDFNIFSDDLILNPLLDLDHVILEVKYNHFLLSYIKDSINQCGKKEVAVSKYCLGRTNL